MIRHFVSSDAEAVVALWHRADLVRPWNDPHEDIARITASDNGRLLISEDEGEVVGTVMVGYDGHRGWVYYLAVDPNRQASGIGRRLIESAEHHLRSLGCPKINLQIRNDNTEALGFYQRMGYQPDAVASLGKRLT